MSYRWGVFLIKIVVAAGCYGYIFTAISTEAFTALLQQLPLLYGIAAWGVFNLSQLVSSIRMQYYLKILVGGVLSFRESVRLYYAAMACNICLPGGIGGDVYKVAVIQRAGKGEVALSGVIRAALAERISGLIALVTIVAALWLYVTHEVVWSVGGMLVVWGVYLIGSHYGLCEPIKATMRAFLLSLIIQGFTILSMLCILYGIGTHTDQIYSLIIIFLLSNIVAILPISIGGMGVREASFLWLGTVFAIPVELGVLCVALYSAIYLSTALIGIMAWFKAHVSLRVSTRRYSAIE